MQKLVKRVEKLILFLFIKLGNKLLNNSWKLLFPHLAFKNQVCIADECTMRGEIIKILFLLAIMRKELITFPSSLPISAIKTNFSLGEKILFSLEREIQSNSLFSFFLWSIILELKAISDHFSILFRSPWWHLIFVFITWKFSFLIKRQIKVEKFSLSEE